MSDSGEQKLARLEALFTALLKHRLSGSLENVDAALKEWRAGSIGPFEAHAELLKHVARAERLASNIAKTDAANAGPVLREAYDAGLLDEAEFRDLVGKGPSEVEPAPGIDDVDLPTLPPKRDFVEDLLEEGPVLVHADPRRDGVNVPGHLAGDPRLVLRFGYGLAPAIVDLAVDDEGISGTLTFGGAPFLCILPWSSVYAAVSEANQQAMVWPDDVPPEVLDQMTRSGTDSADDAGGDEKQQDDEPRKKPTRAGHLKLVE